MHDSPFTIGLLKSSINLKALKAKQRNVPIRGVKEHPLSRGSGGGSFHGG